MTIFTRLFFIQKRQNQVKFSVEYPFKIFFYAPSLFVMYVIWIFTEGDEIEYRLPFKTFSTLKAVW